VAIIGVVSQKGGVGKSTISRALVTEATRCGLRSKLADLDTLQSTSTDWHRLRLAQGIDPVVEVQAYASLSSALRDAPLFDYFILDGPARSTSNTLAVAKAADLIVQPTGCSADDLRPAVRLANELVSRAIPRERLVFVFCRVGSEAEERDSRAYIQEAGFSAIEGSLPERPVYRTGQNHGRSVAEIAVRSLRLRAEQLIGNIGRLLE